MNWASTRWNIAITSPTSMRPSSTSWAWTPGSWRFRAGNAWTSISACPSARSFPEPMKITAIESLVCHARMRNWIFVKVLTDQPGLYGWGEATLEWHTRGVTGAIEDLCQLLIGEDPTRVEHLWQMMYRQHFWHGNGVVRGTAISGIDIALWDILGKVYGVPCHKLWGGPVRDYVRLYSHLGGGHMEEFYCI